MTKSAPGVILPMKFHRKLHRKIAPPGFRILPTHSRQFNLIFNRKSVPHRMSFLQQTTTNILDLGHGVSYFLPFTYSLKTIRELSFFSGRGGRLSVTTGPQFFLFPPFAYTKKFWSHLWLSEKIAVGKGGDQNFLP